MDIVGRRFLDTPTRSAHAASIEFWDGHPVFSWFGGSREGAQDVAIYINNLNNDNKNIIIGDRDASPRWNPILFAYEEKLWLFEKAGTFCDRWQTFIHDITDWDNDIKEKDIRLKCQVLPAGLNGPVKTKPIDFRGYVMCGSAVETFCDWTSYIETYAVVDSSWGYIERSKPLTVKNKVAYRNQNGSTRVSQGIIQPAIWNDGDCIHAFFRASHGLNKIYYSKFDGHWSQPEPTEFANPNSGVDVVYFNDRLFLVSNPDASLRNPLTIKELKMTNHNEWEVLDEIVIREKIEDSDIPACISGELSYPYMIENDGKLHLVYTYGRTKIEYVTISV